MSLVTSIISSRAGSDISSVSNPRRLRKSQFRNGSIDIIANKWDASTLETLQKLERNISLELYVDFTDDVAVAEYWMREFAKKQYMNKCKAVGVHVDSHHSPKQVLKNTYIMLDTWKYWMEEPNCRGVDFWIGKRDVEIHAYPRFLICSHVGSHPQAR